MNTGGLRYYVYLDAIDNIQNKYIYRLRINYGCGSSLLHHYNVCDTIAIILCLIRHCHMFMMSLLYVCNTTVTGLGF